MSSITSPALDERISTAIQDKDKISVKSSKINQRLEHYILKIITDILKKHGQERFTDMIYTILKELAINAVKANQKRIFFEDNHLDIANETDYQEGIVKFKASFSDSMSDEYGRKCMEKGVYCQLNFYHNHTGMYVEVVNNTPVIRTEELRMREKMKSDGLQRHCGILHGQYGQHGRCRSGDCPHNYPTQKRFDRPQSLPNYYKS